MRSAAKADEMTLGLATAVRVTDDWLIVTLSTGREVRSRLATFPRLMNATPDERRNVRIEAFGTSIHWPDVDEDIGVNQLLGVSEDELYRFAGFTVHPSPGEV